MPELTDQSVCARVNSRVCGGDSKLRVQQQAVPSERDVDGRLRQDLCLRGPEDRAIRVQGEVSVGAVCCSLPSWVPYPCPGGYPALSW